MDNKKEAKYEENDQLDDFTVPKNNKDQEQDCMDTEKLRNDKNTNNYLHQTVPGSVLTAFVADGNNIKSRLNKIIHTAASENHINSVVSNLGHSANEKSKQTEPVESSVGQRNGVELRLSGPTLAESNMKDHILSGMVRSVQEDSESKIYEIEIYDFQHVQSIVHIRTAKNKQLISIDIQRHRKVQGVQVEDDEETETDIFDQSSKNEVPPGCIFQALTFLHSSAELIIKLLSVRYPAVLHDFNKTERGKTYISLSQTTHDNDYISLSRTKKAFEEVNEPLDQPGSGKVQKDSKTGQYRNPCQEQNALPAVESREAAQTSFSHPDGTSQDGACVAHRPRGQSKASVQLGVAVFARRTLRRKIVLTVYVFKLSQSKKEFLKLVEMARSNGVGRGISPQNPQILIVDIEDGGAILAEISQLGNKWTAIEHVQEISLARILECDEDMCRFRCETHDADPEDFSCTFHVFQTNRKPNSAKLFVDCELQDPNIEFGVRTFESESSPGHETYTSQIRQVGGFNSQHLANQNTPLSDREAQACKSSHKFGNALRHDLDVSNPEHQEHRRQQDKSEDTSGVLIDCKPSQGNAFLQKDRSQKVNEEVFGHLHSSPYDTVSGEEGKDFQCLTSSPPQKGNMSSSQSTVKLRDEKEIEFQWRSGNEKQDSDHVRIHLQNVNIEHKLRPPEETSFGDSANASGNLTQAHQSLKKEAERTCLANSPLNKAYSTNYDMQMDDAPAATRQTSSVAEQGQSMPESITVRPSGKDNEGSSESEARGEINTSTSNNSCSKDQWRENGRYDSVDFHSPNSSVHSNNSRYSPSAVHSQSTAPSTPEPHSEQSSESLGSGIQKNMNYLQTDGILADNVAQVFSAQLKQFESFSQDKKDSSVNIFTNINVLFHTDNSTNNISNSLVENNVAKIPPEESVTEKEELYNLLAQHLSEDQKEKLVNKMIGRTKGDQPLSDQFQEAYEELLKRPQSILQEVKEVAGDIVGDILKKISFTVASLLLRVNHTDIINTVQVEDVVHYLFQQGVIGTDEKKHILNEIFTNKNRCSQLIEIVRNKGELRTFVAALFRVESNKRYHDLAENLTVY